MNIRTTLEPIIRRRGVKHCAALIGITHPAVSNWLSGENTLSSRLIAKLVDALESEAKGDAAALRRVKRTLSR